jgi:hypothetical protein
MPRHADDVWDEDWTGDDPSDDVVPCPWCRNDVFEDAEQCPSCGQYITDEDCPAVSRPWWVVVGLVLAAFAAWTWVFG